MTVIEQWEEMRAAFEHWFSDEGASLRAIERDMNGDYRLMQASFAWTAWKAAWQAARTCGVALVDGESSLHQTPIPSPMDSEREG